MTAVAVVGGGLIGSAVAVWLAADGFDVTLFERDPDGRPASTGNAGILSLPHVTPLARPGTLMQVPGWMLDPLGPLSVRARDLPVLAPWLARFVASSRPSQVECATNALGFLMKTVLADHQELIRRAALDVYMRRTGALHLYDTDASYRGALVEWKERARHGVDYEELSPVEAMALVPALKGGFVRAILAPETWTVTSPRSILLGLRDAAAARARVRVAEVTAVRPEADRIAVVTADGSEVSADRVVVAGGVWSRDIVRQLDLSVHLETERGYNTTFPDCAIDIPVPLFFDSHGFVASALEDGLRVGGAVELAAVDAPPNFARAGAMREKMRRYVPDLPEAGGMEWMGRRPSTPDSLPVIGPHPRDPRILFAFGHGHVGLTLSAVTARHIADLAAGRPRDRNLEAVGIERFQ